MYTNEQSRINAIISYFFLGPFFLLAKKETPLWDAYVQRHARKATKIIAVMWFFFVIYFSLRDYLDFWILWISLNSVLLAIIVWVNLFFLARWAYNAYLGNVPGDLNTNNLPQIHLQLAGRNTVEKEEDKIRIVASMVPFFGIWVAHKYNNPLMDRARNIWSCIAFFYIISQIISSNVGFLSFVILITGILLFVIEAIYLFIFGSFVTWNILDKIPNYREIEAHIRASITSIIEFILVSFGKEKKWTYIQYYNDNIIQDEVSVGTVEKYFMPIWLIALPFWNIFCIPSLLIERYKLYRTLIIQGLIITLIFAYFYFWRKEFASPYLLLLLFPIVHIFTYGADNPKTSSPWIGLCIRILHFAKLTQRKIIASGEKSETSFRYEPTSATASEYTPKQ